MFYRPSSSSSFLRGLNICVYSTQPATQNASETLKNEKGLTVITVVRTLLVSAHAAFFVER
jgi:hypothetical protein